MASFSVAIKASAVDELRVVPFPFRRQINQRIMRLKDDPYPAGVESLGDSYRWRVGDYRILYEVDERARVVTIAAVRSNAPMQ